MQARAANANGLLARAGSTLVSASQWSDDMSPQEQKMWTQEASSLIDFLEQLGDMATLNRLGFSKLLKKCEKLVPQLKMVSLFQNKVHSAEFCESTKRVDLLSWARNVRFPEAKSAQNRSVELTQASNLHTSSLRATR